jgi:CBS domain-containing protein
MRVSELMTKKVLTIGPEAPIKDVAKILVANGISGLPVCDIERRVLGVVSEGDILYKEHDRARGTLADRSAGSSTEHPATPVSSRRRRSLLGRR